MCLRFSILQGEVGMELTSDVHEVKAGKLGECQKLCNSDKGCARWSHGESTCLLGTMMAGASDGTTSVTRHKSGVFLIPHVVLGGEVLGTKPYTKNHDKIMARALECAGMCMEEKATTCKYWTAKEQHCLFFKGDITVDGEDEKAVSGGGLSHENVAQRERKKLTQ